MYVHDSLYLVSMRSNLPRIRCHHGKLYYSWWPAEISGSVIVQATHLSPGEWWIDLVRVGDPGCRGNGYGTRGLTDVLYILLGFLKAQRIGLEPHSLGHSRDLTEWYKSLGFTQQLGEELWLEREAGLPRQLELR